jgi:ribosome-associated toxin RatA of RatAB toxin-antitoxin module
MERQSHTEVVKASIDLCFDTIVDFPCYPDWFTAITTAEVLDEDVGRCLWTIEYKLNMLVKTISYTLAYEGERPSLLTWKLVRGDVKDVQGTYRFVELEPGLTEATCTQGVDVGFWIPGPLRRTFEKTALVDSVREFKKAAEERARAPRRA